MSKFNNSNENLFITDITKENKENIICANNYQEENSQLPNDIKAEETFIKEKDYTFLDQSQLENLLDDTEKFKELINFISEKSSNTDCVYRNYLNELNENKYFNLEEEKINLKADIKNLEKIYEEETKSEYFVNKSKIRFAFKSFIFSQINILDIKNLVVKLRNNFNIEITNDKNLYEETNEFKLKIENIIKDNDYQSTYSNCESKSKTKNLLVIL